MRFTFSADYQGAEVSVHGTPRDVFDTVPGEAIEVGKRDDKTPVILKRNTVKNVRITHFLASDESEGYELGFSTGAGQARDDDATSSVPPDPADLSADIDAEGGGLHAGN